MHLMCGVIVWKMYLLLSYSIDLGICLYLSELLW